MCTMLSKAGYSKQVQVNGTLEIHDENKYFIATIKEFYRIDDFIWNMFETHSGFTLRSDKNGIVHPIDHEYDSLEPFIFFSAYLFLLFLVYFPCLKIIVILLET